MRQATLFPVGIQERFGRWIDANPVAYQTIVRLAREAKARGKRRIGMKMLFEVCRWEFWLDVEGDDFKMNNVFAAPMARLVMEREPDLAGMFELRRRRSE